MAKYFYNDLDPYTLPKYVIDYIFDDDKTAGKELYTIISKKVIKKLNN